MSCKFGFVPTSFVDSPGGTSSVVFFDRCNVRCPYCHQAKLLTGGGEFDLQEIKDKIYNHSFKNGKPRTEWLILSGGEPTLFSREMLELIDFGKSTGRKVGIWTNGMTDLKSVEADWFNIDYKWRFDDYANKCGATNEQAVRIKENMFEMLMDHDRWFRLTTVITHSHTDAYIGEMVKSLLLNVVNRYSRGLIMGDANGPLFTWRFVPFRAMSLDAILNADLLDAMVIIPMREVRARVKRAMPSQNYWAVKVEGGD